ncbi:CENPC protein, partial [Trogon melanurus]|nr:CENPC protein [Trogon melanurus]
PSENKTESKKGKNTKAEVKALTKEKVDDGSVSRHDSRGTAESDPVSNSEEKALKSQKQNSTHRGKTKKNALSRGSQNRKKGTSWKLEDEELMLPQPELEKDDEELMLPQPELEKKPPGAEQGKTGVMPGKDSPVPSAGHQQEQPASPKKNLKSSKSLQSASKSSLRSVRKKQTSKQKPPKDAVAKRLAESPRKKLTKSGKKSSSKKHQLQKEKSSDSKPGEELEREPVKSSEVCTTPLNQKLQTFEVQKSTEKPENMVRALKSLGGENNETLKAVLQQLLDSIKKSEKKQLSVKPSEETPKKIHARTSKDVCSDPENTELQNESDSSSERDTAKRKQKLPDVKIKRNKRKRDTQQGLDGPVVEYGDEFASRSKSRERDNISSDKSEEFNNDLGSLLPDNIPRHKIVMPSNTPNVRRTKRIRLKPLEYWRGERVNYVMRPSGGFVVSGIQSPETEPHRKVKRRGNHKQETGDEILESLGHTLADASKPTIVLDPVTNEEVLLECINSETNHSCFFKGEAAEIHKNLNTSAFAMGRLILKPLKEKGYQFVHMDTVAFYVIHGKVIVTLHKTSYCLTTGDFFYVPEG